MQVIWQKNTQNNEWFDLLRLDLSASYFTASPKKGVFAIWYVAPGRAKVIKVGSGNLSEQLKNLRSNPIIIDFSKNGPLKVSWIAINGVPQENQMSGVEAYLYDKYTPLLGERPVATPISVNLIGE